MCDGVIKITQSNGCYWAGVVSQYHPLKDGVPSELPSEHTQKGAGRGGPRVVSQPARVLKPCWSFGDRKLLIEGEKQIAGRSPMWGRPSALCSLQGTPAVASGWTWICFAISNLRLLALHPPGPGRKWVSSPILLSSVHLCGNPVT